MQAIARWLVARPYNAVLALVVTLLLPAPQLTSGAVIALLVVASGPRAAVTAALLAAAILVVTSMIMGGSPQADVILMAGTWIPVMLLALALVTTRSLTLTLQMSVIAAVAVFLVFQVAVPDPAAFWQPILDVMDEIIRESELQLNTELLTADVMTVSAVLVFWALYSGALLLGYGLYCRLPAETESYGRFRDLNFGRVIALALAILSLLAFVIGADFLQNVAFIVFVTFTMQGLAIVHWLHGDGKLPAFAVVSVYILLPFLQVLLVMVLALIGYTDAWFGFRRRTDRT